MYLKWDWLCSIMCGFVTGNGGFVQGMVINVWHSLIVSRKLYVWVYWHTVCLDVQCVFLCEQCRQVLLGLLV